jgi:hypothetical protein
LPLFLPTLLPPPPFSAALTVPLPQAFGSLIVAILDLLRAAVQLLQSYASSEGNTIGAAIACVAQCCIGCLTSAVEYFNRAFFSFPVPPFSTLLSSTPPLALSSILPSFIPNFSSSTPGYAYIEIALYGKPYIGAAKDTWRLFKDRGITALINDCLIGNMYALFPALHLPSSPD